MVRRPELRMGSRAPQAARQRAGRAGRVRAHGRGGARDVLCVVRARLRCGMAGERRGVARVGGVWAGDRGAWLAGPKGFAGTRVGSGVGVGELVPRPCA